MEEEEIEVVSLEVYQFGHWRVGESWGVVGRTKGSLRQKLSRSHRPASVSALESSNALAYTHCLNFVVVWERFHGGSRLTRHLGLVLKPLRALSFQLRRIFLCCPS